MPYWKLYYHLVWATHSRAPLIVAELEPGLHNYLRGKAIDLGGYVHGVGGIEDHVHLVVSIPPRIAISKFIGQVKGASSHWVNHLTDYAGRFRWQEGYGVFSFGKRALSFVVDYVREQRRRHEEGRLVAMMERFEE